MITKYVKGIAACAVGMVLAAGAAHAEVKLRMANWLPMSHPLMKDVMIPWAEQVEQATEGRVTVEILSAPLGPPPAHYDFAANGVADITYGVHAYTPGRFTATAIAELPFLSDSAEALSVAYWRTYQQKLAHLGEHDNVKLLTLFTHGPGLIFTRNRDLGSLADLRGAKLRVAGSLSNDIVQALGAVPVQAPSSKAYELLSGGVADGIMFPYESVVFFNLTDLLDSGLGVPGGFYNTSFFVVMNRARWDALSEADKAAIDSVSGEAFARLAGKAWDAADAAGRAAMQGEIEVRQVSPEQFPEVEATLQPVVDRVLVRISEKGVNAQEVLATLKGEVKAASGTP